MSDGLQPCPGEGVTCPPFEPVTLGDVDRTAAAVGAGGWCAPSALLYDPADRPAFDRAHLSADAVHAHLARYPELNLERIELPEVRADRGGLTWAQRTPAEQAAHDALTARLQRHLDAWAALRRMTIDRACVVALAEGWDVHAYLPRPPALRAYGDPGTLRLGYVGIAFEPRQHPIPTVHYHRDHDVSWMDDDEF